MFGFFDTFFAHPFISVTLSGIGVVIIQFISKKIKGILNRMNMNQENDKKEDNGDIQVESECNEVKVIKIINLIAVIAATIASLLSIYLGWTLGSSKENVQELQNQLIQASQKIEELERQLNSDGEDASNPETPIKYSDLSAKELIDQNFDLIMQLKEKYSNAETVIIESDRVRFEICEKAGYIYQDSTEIEKYYILQGEHLPHAKMIILDYTNDKIIYDFSPQKDEEVIYSPGNNNTFYCVVFHDDYNIYVSAPVQVIGGEAYERIEINLEKEDFKYTPLFRFRLYIQDLKTDEAYSIASGASEHKYYGNYKIQNKYSNGECGNYSSRMSDSGMLEWGIYSYFSLNTNYVMDISLSRDNDFSFQSTHYTFDGSVTNSNIVDIYLEFADENE